MLIVTTDTIPGKEIIEVKGLVRGSTIRSKHLGKDISAAFKNLTGGGPSDCYWTYGRRCRGKGSKCNYWNAFNVIISDEWGSRNGCLWNRCDY